MIFIFYWLPVIICFWAFILRIKEDLLHDYLGRKLSSIRVVNLEYILAGAFIIFVPVFNIITSIYFVKSWITTLKSFFTKH